MTGKAIADYSASEAAEEIRSIAGKGSRVDMLAGHLMLLAINAQTTLSNEREGSAAVISRNRRLIGSINRLLSDTHGRKTVNRDRLVTLYREARL